MLPLQDVLERYKQLASWTGGTLVTPNSVWLPGLFNPKAFLTAIMQVRTWGKRGGGERS